MVVQIRMFKNILKLF